jgi:hypothetical protein
MNKFQRDAFNYSEINYISINGGGVGLIYILSDKANSISKIGRTTDGDPTRRARDYGKVDAYEFQVVYSITTCRVSEVETLIHEYYKKKRIDVPSGAREIYKIKPSHAKSQIQRFVLSPIKDGIPERTELMAHIERMRTRLRAFEGAYSSRRDAGRRSGLPPLEEIYRKSITLDAVELGVAFEDIVNRYENMIRKYNAERERIERIFQDQISIYKASGFWNRVFGSAPQPQRENFEYDRFPLPPKYAQYLLQVYPIRAQRER